MDLSNKIIAQFVKITNDKDIKEELAKTYGTVVIENDQVYVKLDGSDILTPVDTTVYVKNNDRVTVTIRNHNATIDGNFTDISASNDYLNNVDVALSEFQNETVNNISNMNEKIYTIDSNVADNNERLDDIDNNLVNLGNITINITNELNELRDNSEVYATEEYVKNEIAKAQLSDDGDIDLSGYVTETELNNKGYLTSVPSEYVTETELSAKGYINNQGLTAGMSSATNNSKKYTDEQISALNAAIESIETRISKINTIVTYVYLNGFTVPGWGALDVEVTVNGISSGSEYVIMVSPSAWLEGTLSFQAFKRGDNLINIRFANHSGESVSTTYQRWNILCQEIY